MRRISFFSNLSTREGAAIKQSWNNMTGIKQWKVSEGTTIIKGKAASQIENAIEDVRNGIIEGENEKQLIKI